MPDRLTQLEAEADKALAGVDSAQSLEEFRIAYLGTKGKLKGAMSWLKDASREERPALGQELNKLKKKLEAAFSEKKAAIGDGGVGGDDGVMLDVTEPGFESRLGRVHILTQVIDEMIDVFGRMGFEVAEGPEVEDVYHNFEALNIPFDHPARDPLENHYLDDSHLLRAMTSTVQVRVMEKARPPIRIISPGRVYRPDTHDATHSSMFHQLEGLYVDHDVSMVDLKTTLFQFARAFFGEHADVRMRPSYFPFTEPSAEVDMMMNVKGKWQWVEIGGCGMVDPNVFDEMGYDNEEWTGFAFGMGIERIAMIRYGIPDIRMFFENDVRFLKQF